VLLRAASLLVPASFRAEWLAEWRAELWYVPRPDALRFCLGAFRDALWLRRNSPSSHLESPLACLAFLALLAVVSLAIALRLPFPPHGPWPAHLRLRDLPEGCLAMLLLSALMLPAMRLAMGTTLWPRRLRGWLFLALKLALLQPIMLCGFSVLLLIGSVVPIAPQLGIFATWMLTFRWVLLDQRRRCPVCLHLLTCHVRIGTPSHTFLEWYGGESICARGHGLLHVPEVAASYSAGERWLALDNSWTALF
jgi:hypothetical protein